MAAGFSHNYNSHEVDEIEMAGLSKINDLYSYHPLGVYNVNDSDFCLIPLMIILQTPE